MNAVIALVGGPGAILEPYTLRLMRLPNQAEGYPNPTFWHFSYGFPVFSDAYKDFYGLRSAASTSDTRGWRLRPARRGFPKTRG